MANILNINKYTVAPPFLLSTWYCQNLWMHLHHDLDKKVTLYFRNCYLNQLKSLFLNPTIIKICVSRESNPDQLLGRQLCWPLYHWRLLKLRVIYNINKILWNYVLLSISWFTMLFRNSNKNRASNWILIYGCFQLKWKKGVSEFPAVHKHFKFHCRHTKMHHLLPCYYLH